MNNQELNNPSNKPDPYLNEQDEGIIKAFSRETEKLLTTKQIQEHLDIGERQTRRRLRSLAERGVLGSQMVGGCGYGILIRKSVNQSP